jgi:signal transduction histidine kinase
MLHDFITKNRTDLIARTRARVTQRKAPRATQPELEGIPTFFTQLVALLKETMTNGEEDAARHVVAETAAAHARELLQQGLSIAQVVHDYGDVCQVVTELAVQRKAPITAEDFRAFNRCLDDAIAGAVTEYAQVREESIVAEGVERLGVLGHELRNVLSSAILSFDTIKRGVTGTGGSVAALHTRSLMRLRNLVDRALTEVRLDASMITRERVTVAAFVEEAEIAATIQAQAVGLEFSIAPVDPDLVVEIDRHVMGGALANLLQNAFKFTRAHGAVSITTHATAQRVCIDVEDQCGGLPDGKVEDLFRPYEQRSANRSGVGLGLLIARRAVAANGGELRVQNLPRVGCRFTIDLPNRTAHSGRPEAPVAKTLK